MHSILSTANSNGPIWISFFTFSSQIAVARASNTMWNKNDKSGHPCLVSGHRGNIFSFSPLSMVHHWLIVYGFYYVEVCSLNTLFLDSLYHKWIEFCQKISASIEMIVCFLFFNLLTWCIALIDLWILKTSCIPGINLT